MDPLRVASLCAVLILASSAPSAAAETFPGVGGKRVAYETFDEGVEGPSIVMLTGFSESYAFYEELVDDFRGAGYSVYIMDHRGMGRSERLTANPQIVHVEKFSDYVDDAQTFVTTIVPKAARPLYLFAHSTGALIGLTLMARQPDLFKAVVFSAPLVKADTSPIPLPLARLLLNLADKVGFAESYALGYEDLVLEQFKFQDNRTTHDEGHFNRRMDQYRSEPSLLMSGPSNRWGAEVLRATDQVARLAPKVSAPILILQAGDDHFVDEAAQNDLCEALPNCRLETFPESFHEIFRERAEIRQTALAAALMHLERAGQQ